MAPIAALADGGRVFADALPVYSTTTIVDAIEEATAAVAGGAVLAKKILAP